jgi:DUF4097 and DUF4098 domain-containing protein YvlB
LSSRWRAPRGWNAAVLISAAIVVLLALVTVIWWLTSRESHTTRYLISGPVSRLNLQLSSGQAVIVGSSSSSVEVRRTDDFAFGHAATEQRSLRRGVLQISSRCPRIVLGSCSASYEVAVPETVTVHVTTKGGHVRLDGFRGNAAVQTTSGNIDVAAYCGFALLASSASGNVHVAAACAPQRLTVHSESGDAVALVPPGRYRLSASSSNGRPRISGVTRDPRAAFSIDVHSGSGLAAVEGGL